MDVIIIKHYDSADVKPFKVNTAIFCVILPALVRGRLGAGGQKLHVFTDVLPRVDQLEL